MWCDAKNSVAIVGVGHSRVGRRLSRPVGLLALDAARAAAEDAGLKVSNIDGLCLSAGPPLGPDAVPGLRSAPVEWMAEALQLKRVDWWTTDVRNISMAVGYAVQALATNSCKYVLLWRAEHQPRRGGASNGSTVAPKAEGEAAYSAPYGLSGTAIRYALAFMRYMKRFGAKREHLAAYVLAARKGANNNPNAVFYSERLAIADYMGARMIADPLCLYDCDMPVDGAGAIVLTRAERAKDLRRQPAFVSALGSAGWNRDVLPPEEYEDNPGNLGRILWASAGLTPKDIDGAMLYDGFSPSIFWWLEGLGFCGRGEAFDWIQHGRIELGGDLPVNTFGGSIGEGRLHGIGHWIEATKQIQGRADDRPGDGARQIANARNILVATGMTGHNAGGILSKELPA